MAVIDIPKDLKQNYEIHEWRHASAILVKDFPQEWADICDVLGKFKLLKSRVAVPGGSKSLISAALDSGLAALGWTERQFRTAITVDDNKIESPTHKVDCFKNQVGLEIEWNNKDPFFDRDLNNFRLLFELRALSVGIIVTRCDELQIIFNKLGRGSSYGNSTTHMGKLLPRLRGGGGGGCPILVFGISKRLLVADISDDEVTALQDEFKVARKSKWTNIGPALKKHFSLEMLKKASATNDEEE